MNFNVRIFHFLVIFTAVICSNCSDLGVRKTTNYGLGNALLQKARRLRRQAYEEIENVCTDPLHRPIKHLWPLKGDHNINLKLVWIGKNSETQLLLTTLEIGALFFKITAPSKLYRSNDDGFTFQPIQEEIKNGHIRTDYGILKNLLNPSKVLLISYNMVMSIKKSTLYISKDGSKTWSSVEIPFRVRSDEPIILHPTQEDWLVALESGGKRSAWLSTDFGSTWKKLKDNAEAVKWGAKLSDPKEEKTIFVTEGHYIAGIFKKNDMSLWRSRDLGENFKLLHDSIFSLGIQEEFLYISVSLDKDKRTRVMHVSKDNGDTFNRVRVPEVTPERFYAILDTSEGQIFLHVDEPEDTGKGTLFLSDTDGIMYTKSLENHFYTNDGLTDFYKVESMRGVFLTHKLEADKTLTSVITFDRGSTWHDLYLTDAQCKGGIQRPNSKCSLHYHHVFSKAKGHFVQGPLSTPTALGIILLHGVNGDALTTNGTNVYMSRNGGYNWTKVLEGPHHYAIGDHGNLIVAVSQLYGNKTNVTTLYYSLDQGRCWNSLKFSDDPMIIKEIVTEPHSKKRSFSLWGYFKDPDQKSVDWQVVTVNFHNVFTRKCQSDDFEYWYPHAIGRKDGCFLGIKEGYPRTKQKTMCFSGEDYKPKVTKEHCKCTLQDLECDFGYEKDVLGKCIRDETVKLEVCKNGDEERIDEGQGYRRVPGDECQGGEDKLIASRIKYIDTKKACKPKELDSDQQPMKDQQPTKPKKSSSVKGWVIFSTVCFLLAVIGGTGYLFWKNNLNDRRRINYRYSKLEGEDDDMIEEVNGYDPRPKGLRNYRDESDAESDAEMLKL
eukprot:gene6074-6776_t